ncbi:MAG: hypothetical protein RLZZ292_2951 [Bacteroidota bacterium]|jgi:hypothetical protein
MRKHYLFLLFIVLQNTNATSLLAAPLPIFKTMVETNPLALDENTAIVKLSLSVMSIEIRTNVSLNAGKNWQTMSWSSFKTVFGGKYKIPSLTDLAFVWDKGRLVSLFFLEKKEQKS